MASLARNGALQPLPPPRTPRRTWDAPVHVAPAPAQPSPPRAAPPPRPAAAQRAALPPLPLDADPAERAARSLHAWLVALRLPACPAEASAQALAAAVSRGQLLLQLVSRLERRDLPGVAWHITRGADADEAPRRAARAHDLRVALQTLQLQPAVPRRFLRAEAALLEASDADVALGLLADVRGAAPYRWAKAGLALLAGGAHLESVAAMQPRAPLGVAPEPRRAAASAPLPSVRAARAAGVQPFQRAACSAC